MKLPQTWRKRSDTPISSFATDAVLALRRKGAKEIQTRVFEPSRLHVRKLFGLAVVFCILLFVAACAETNNNSNTPVISGPPSTTYPMPPLNGASIVNMGWEFRDGTRSVFSDYRGKVLVLDFYATWCVPCRDSVPHLMGLHKKYEGQGLRVIGLNVGGPGDAEQVPAFAKELGIQYALATPDEDLASLLLAGNDAIPQTFVFDRQGKLVEHLIGFGPASGEIIDRAVENALQTAAP